jgi:cytochrome bd-type quinol oxidase subunit 1
MRIAYAIVTVAYLAAAMLRVKLKETLPTNKDDSKPNILEAIKVYPRAVRESLHVWSRVPKSAFYLFLAVAGINSLLMGCNTYFVVYATSVLKIEKFQWAIVMAFMSLSVAFPSILAGLRMDTVGRKRFLILSFLLYTPAMLLFIYANFYVLLLAFFLFGLPISHW